MHTHPRFLLIAIIKLERCELLFVTTSHYSKNLFSHDEKMEFCGKGPDNWRSHNVAAVL